MDYVREMMKEAEAVRQANEANSGTVIRFNFGDETLFYYDDDSKLVLSDRDGVTAEVLNVDRAKLEQMIRALKHIKSVI